MSTKLRPISLAIIATLATSTAIAEELQPIIVSADLRESTEQDIPASVDVKTQADLQDQGATHFDDVLLKTPNVNFSGQSSRARHIQIRGMGERDEYTGAPNSSVGFAIDDIDFSGIGMTGNLFDVKQVEVLRGPQNTRYGQSAIGGLINIQTNDPTATRESMVEATIGQDNHKELGVMTSGPVSSKEDAAQYRIAIFKHNSDGFRTNETLDRKDTNGRDELTLRGKLRFFPDSDTTVDVSAIHADLDNGYDAWSRDNSFTTLSDEPGEDDMLTNAASVKLEWNGNPNYNLTSKTSLSDVDMNYNYDLDWIDYDPARTIGFFGNKLKRKTFSQDLKFESTPSSKIFNRSTDWVVGIYFSQLDEENVREETWQSRYGYTGGDPDIFNSNSESDFSNQKIALYTQLDQAISTKATLTYGLRIETNQKEFEQAAMKYSAYNTYDNDGNWTGYVPPYEYQITDSFNTDETLWGGSLAYSYKYNATHTAFTSITRGYKSGGFNVGQYNQQNTTFDTETSYNYELGLKSNYPNIGLTTSTTAFYTDRHNPQFDGYSYEPGGYEWVFFTENLESATNYGLETEFDWEA
ncbi:MAG: TonB-dependent receptor, partial [Pseudomonadota bacterium]|nr:TonB-dependent receptor [Pseudomonadota bacterium]